MHLLDAFGAPYVRQSVLTSETVSLERKASGAITQSLPGSATMRVYNYVIRRRSSLSLIDQSFMRAMGWVSLLVLPRPATRAASQVFLPPPAWEKQWKGKNL